MAMGVILGRLKYSIASNRRGKKEKLPSEWHICAF